MSTEQRDKPVLENTRDAKKARTGAAEGKVKRECRVGYVDRGTELTVLTCDRQGLFDVSSRCSLECISLLTLHVQCP